MTKSFVDISDFNKKDLTRILDLAKIIKKKPSKYSNILKSKSLGMIFDQQSMRTRVSFDIGMKKLGGNVIELNQNSIGFGKRESDSDAIKVLSQYVDCLMIRCSDHQKIKNLSNLNCLPIINGLSNFSHPCQILSDIFTIQEYKGDIKNQVILWIGDINNVLISLLQSAKIFKFVLNVASPKSILLNNKKLINNYISEKINFYDEINTSLSSADILMTDVWTSMGQKESAKKISALKNFQINDKILKKSKKECLFMHCLPAKRNLEVTDSVIDGKNSIVWNQAKNRMFVQQSILLYCLS